MSLTVEILGALGGSLPTISSLIMLIEIMGAQIVIDLKEQRASVRTV
jgi:hypothetical protein